MKYLLLLLMTTPIFAQEPFTQNEYIITVNFLKQSYIGNEPINVTVTINNPSHQEKQLTIADSFYNSILFELRTSQNSIIPIKNDVIAKSRLRFANPTTYRSITLFQGESFSQTFNLRDFFDIRDAGTYYINAKFFPDPDNHTLSFASEFSMFSQSIPNIVQQQISRDIEIRQAEEERLGRLLPNEIIQSFFESQKRRDWEFFLLHIDLARLIYSFPNYSRQYDLALTGNVRLDIIEQFKRFLTVHWNLPLISYEIEETVIQNDTATVSVVATESVRTTSRKLRYNFILYKSGDGSWLISEYFVLSLN